MSSPKPPSASAQLIPLTPTNEPIHGVRVGRVTGIDTAGIPLVDFADNPTGHPLPARTTLAQGQTEWLEAARSHQEALLVFEAGDPQKPLITGLLQQPKAAPRTEALLATMSVPKDTSGTTSVAPLQVREVNGRLILQAAKEITLECGKASITLQRDGTVQVRGVRIESRASGPHLIRGGKIELN